MEGVFSLTQRDVLTLKVSPNLFILFDLLYFYLLHYSSQKNLKMHIQMIGLINLYYKLDLFPSISKDFVINRMDDGTFWKNSHEILN